MKKQIISIATVLFMLGAAVNMVVGEDYSVIAAKEWRDYIAPMTGTAQRMVNELANPSDEKLRKEMYRYMFAQIATSYVGLMYADPEYPDLWPLFSKVFDGLFPNPDDVYHFTPINDDGVYKLSGYRGTVRFVDFQVGSGTLMAYGYGKLGPNLASYDIDDLSLGEKGAFEVILSPNRPEGYTGDWWKLPAGSQHLFLRQVSYDWENEVDARIGIQRLDRPALKPKPTQAQLDKQLRGVATWVDTWLEFSFDWVGAKREERGVNKAFYIMPYNDVGGLQRQRYSELNFDIKEDEALVVETELADTCQYWSFQILDEWMRTVEVARRRTNINGFTAKLDADGKFRMVVSLQDPGVPNWLDTGEFERGMVVGRMADCEKWPLPSVKKVKLVEVREHLPKETPVVTAIARDQQLRARQRAFQLRRRW